MKLDRSVLPWYVRAYLVYQAVVDTVCCWLCARRGRWGPWVAERVWRVTGLWG